MWRASTATLAFGRKEIPAAIAAPAPAEQDVAPTDAAVAPGAAAAKPAPTTEAPAEAAIAPVDNADAATAAQAEALVQSALPSADELATKKAEQFAGPTSEEKRGALGPPPLKRAKLQHDNDARPATPARCVKHDEKCFHFIELTRDYLTNDMSTEYQKMLRRAAKLTPAERAALLTSLAGMIQEDQAKSLQLLEHSITVTEHFTRKAPKVDSGCK